MYKVLIVDDEVLVRVGLKTTINWEEIGFKIISEASNGEQGYEIYQKHKPDVIITDIKMPKQDGLWLVENIRKEDAEAKILVLTCYDEFSYARKALKAGADDYILKSEIEDEELIKLMSSIKDKLDLLYQEKAKKEVHIGKSENIKRTIFADLEKKSFDIDDKLLMELKEVGFPTSDTNYAYMGISILQSQDRIADTSQVIGAVMNLLYEQLNQDEIIYIDGSKNNKHLLFLSAPGLNTTQLKRILSTVVNGAKQYFDISINAMYSGVFGQLDLAGRKYQDYAERLQILFYKRKGNHQIMKEDTIAFSQPNVFELKKRFNLNYIEAIGHESMEKVGEMIQEMGQYFEQNTVSPMITKIFYSNLMGDLFSSYGYFLNENEAFETHETYHYRLLHFEYIEEINLLLLDFSTDLINEIRNVRNNNSKAMIHQALNFIEHHFREDISLDDVAKELNLSKYYLCSVFKKETGENMSLYINKLRIEEAKQLLLEPDVKIKDIFEKVGYSNQQYFSKIFKKITGMTIIEYREGMEKK